MIKGILFDKDGTLIEFESTWHQIMTLVFKRMKAQLEIDDRTLDFLKEMSGYTESGFQKESMIQYKSTNEIIDKWVSSIEAGSSIMKDRIMDIFETSSIDNRIKFKPLKGSLDALEYLYKKGYSLGIATADTRSSAIHSLKKAGMLDYFHYVGADDGTTKAKPDPQMAEQFCHIYKIETDELLIVGDSYNDFTFAEKAGAKFAGITTEYNSLNIGSSNNTVLINSLGDLAEEFNL